MRMWDFEAFCVSIFSALSALALYGKGNKGQGNNIHGFTPIRKINTLETFPL